MLGDELFVRNTVEKFYEQRALGCVSVKGKIEVNKSEIEGM